MRTMIRTTTLAAAALIAVTFTASAFGQSQASAYDEAVDTIIEGLLSDQQGGLDISSSMMAIPMLRIPPLWKTYICRCYALGGPCGFGVVVYQDMSGEACQCLDGSEGIESCYQVTGLGAN